MTIEILSFDSEPGTYEIETVGDKTYEVTIPESFTKPGKLIISYASGKIDDEVGPTLTLLDALIEVGKPGEFSVLTKDRPREVLTPVAKAIERVFS